MAAARVAGEVGGLLVMALRLGDHCGVGTPRRIVGRPLERDASVIDHSIDRGAPRHVTRPPVTQRREHPAHPRQVASSQVGELSPLTADLACVLADRLEDPVAGRRTGDEAGQVSIDEAPEHREHVDGWAFGDDGHGIEVERRSEHTQRPQQVPLVVPEQVVAPLDRRPQRPVALVAGVPDAQELVADQQRPTDTVDAEAGDTRAAASSMAGAIPSSR